LLDEITTPKNMISKKQIPVDRPYFNYAWKTGTKTKPERLMYLAIKRIIDIAIACVLLPIIIPILLLVAACILLESPGSIIFYQMRTGKGGRKFKMYKLRSMVKNAEALKAELQHLNGLSYPDFKIEDDPRITKVGKFIRKTSIDEFPQIYNILKGEMSFVGPRPTSFGAETYNLWHTKRLEVKPGLTGLWQVSGRNEIDFDERVRLDISYCDNRSIFLDFKIMLRTFKAVFSGRGAN